jgi:hypothetical protein
VCLRITLFSCAHLIYINNKREVESGGAGKHEREELVGKAARAERDEAARVDFDFNLFRRAVKLWCTSCHIFRRELLASDVLFVALPKKQRVIIR